jgi:hypothetical protein
MRTALRTGLLALAAVSLSPAYYHWIHFQSTSGPYTPVYEKFDLNSLPSKTLSYFVSEQGPTALAPGDSYTAILSQIRAAANAWNSVETSEIKLAFGGLHTPGTAMNNPRVEVEFSDELQPGILALGGIVSRLDPVSGPNGTFVPISKSLLRLPNDLSSRPSYTESFFLTLVHEFGHTMGLQHTWTSAVMSTEITRSTSKGRPLTSDDIAGLSILYPSSSFAQKTGVVTGRVALNGAGVNLASVVAIAPGSPAVSTLTNPDGTYRLEGLPPGYYFLYVHPLPPSIAGERQPVNLEPPTDSNGPILPGPAFNTVFYPGTAQPQQTLQIQAGVQLDGFNFDVTQRDRVNLFGVTTYSYFGNFPVKPATLVLGNQVVTTVLTGYGIPTNGAGLDISVISAPETVAPGGIRPYVSPFLIADFLLTPVSGEGVRHLLFNYNGERYVLPSGLSLRQMNPPSLQQIVSNGDGTVSLTGSGFNSATQVWFDGVPAKPGLQPDGSIRVQPPPAAPGYHSVIAALNPDGQSSLYAQTATAPAFSYDASAPQLQFAVSPLALPAGVETVLQVDAAGAAFDQWPSKLGLGTSDVTILRTVAAGPSKLLVQVSTSPQAAPGSVTTTLVSGLQLGSLSGSFQLQSGPPQPYFQLSQLPSSAIYAGSMLVLPISGGPLSLAPGASSVTIGGVPATIIGYTNGGLTIQVPQSLPAGPAILQASLNGTTVLPGLLEIAPPPPIILQAQTVNSASITNTNAARPGDTVQLVVTSLSADGVSPIDASRVHAYSGTLFHSVQSVTPNTQWPGTYIVQVGLALDSPTSSLLPISVSIDDRASSPFLMPFRP